jgi:hypothetical protein
MTDYDLKLQQLQKEFIEINTKRANKWQFTPDQKAIYDFVIKSQRYTTFNIAGYDIILKVGNEDFGFKHFLLKHYGTGCVGEIKANDILKLGNVIKHNISVPAKEDKIKFIQTKGDLKYSVVLKPQKDGKLVVSFFSSKEEIKIIEQIEIINEIIISVEIETKL